MQNNRNYFIAIALSVLIVLGWQYFIMGPRIEAQRLAEQARPGDGRAEPERPGLNSGGAAQ